MIPVKLHMQDFLSYADESFDFSEIQSATVIGKNGAGKSSFCTDAITWALFGQGSKGGPTEKANYVRRGANSCLVEFTFEMSGNLYKVVRNYNITNKKSSLVLFGYTAAGDEVPLSEGAIEAQKRIISLLRMTYEVFTAASIVLQNQIHAFTEGMKDNDKKATLLSILNVNIWDSYHKRNADAIKKLKSELDVNEGKLRVAKEIIAREPECEQELSSAQKNLSVLKSAVDEAKKIVADATRALEAAKAKEDALGSLRSLIASKEETIAMRQSAHDSAVREANDAKSQQVQINASMEKIAKIIAHADEIRSAVEEENALTRTLENMTVAKTQYDVAIKNLENIKKMGKTWNDTHAQKISTLQARLSEKNSQSALVQNVPCFNTAYSPKCPLLKIAYEAKAEAEKISSELVSVQAEVNPYREQWRDEDTKRKALAAQFSDDEIQKASARLVEVKRYSALLPRLDAASEQMAGYQSMLLQAQATENNKTAEAQKATADIDTLHAEVSRLNAELAEKSANVNLVDISTSYNIATDFLSKKESEERLGAEAVAKIEAELSRIRTEKERVCGLEEEMSRIEEEKKVLDVFADACNKINGVPAFMVAAAKPELEANANAVLERMMDGRLQIRFRTSKDGDDSVGSQFRIEVMEMSEVEPRDFSTFSGAEKFIMALAIRIAMSQFLAHRAGASVQLFVLDEGVSCADEDNREEIIQALRRVADDFAKVLFITHDEELKDALDSKIIVRKDSTGSHLAVEG